MRDVRDADGFLAAIERRRRQIDLRIEQLKARRMEIGLRGLRGSSLDEARAAQESALEAHQHALRAHGRLGRNHERAAEAHQHAATVLDRYGAHDRAAYHRRAAAQMRGSARYHTHAAIPTGDRNTP